MNEILPQSTQRPRKTTNDDEKGARNGASESAVRRNGAQGYYLFFLPDFSAILAISAVCQAVGGEIGLWNTFSA